MKQVEEVEVVLMNNIVYVYIHYIVICFTIYYPVILGIDIS